MLQIEVRPQRSINLANLKRCQAHDRQGETFCIDCGLVLCLQCCSYYGRCMGCNIKATAPIFVVSDNK